MNKIPYPTDEELDAMYAEYLKNGSFDELFEDIPF